MCRRSAACVRLPTSTIFTKYFRRLRFTPGSWGEVHFHESSKARRQGQSAVSRGHKACLCGQTKLVLAPSAHGCLPSVLPIPQGYTVNSSRISARMRRIKPSPTSAAQDRANELRREGRDHRQPGGGRAGLRHAGAHPPRRVRGDRARRDALHADRRHARAARRRSRKSSNARTGSRYAPNEIIVTSGAKHAIFNTLGGHAEAGR